MGELEVGVNRLLGSTVKSVGRAMNMGIIEFALPRETMRLHIQCHFRIVHDDRVVLGAIDVRYSSGGVATADQFERFETVYDTRASLINSMLGELSPVVTGVDLGKAGMLLLNWDPLFSLEVFPACSGNVEMWRLLTPGGDHYGFPQQSI